LIISFGTYARWLYYSEKQLYSAIIKSFKFKI